MSGTAFATEAPETVASRTAAGARRLEIGPRDLPLEGYEHLDLRAGPHIEHVADAAGPLPFADNTFDEIHASHVIEHIPWYRTEDTLREWFRILKPGGHAEIWTNDFEALCRRYMKKRAFTSKTNEFRDLNPGNTLQKWLNIKLFWYDYLGHPEEWHRAVFDFVFLQRLAAGAGFNVFYRLERHEHRGPDHGILEFGIRAYKQGNSARLLRARSAQVRAFRTHQLVHTVKAVPLGCARVVGRVARAVLRRLRILGSLAPNG